MTLKGEKPRNFFSSVEKLKITAILTESIRKLGLLGKINQSHDNSSELAGFEINKLLKEQFKLETTYNTLIAEKNDLKGIVHKKELVTVHAKISDVSKSLKECTKKLCRLFKENKNLNEDIAKVKTERFEAIQFFNKFKDNLSQRNFDSFETEIIGQLQGHNKLQEFQQKEKDLIRQIKKLKQDIQIETKSFNTEMNIKNERINNLNEDLQKTNAEFDLKMKFRIKELRAVEETERRLYYQKEERMISEKTYLEGIKRREEAVYERNEQYLVIQNEELKQKLRETTVS